MTNHRRRHRSYARTRHTHARVPSPLLSTLGAVALTGAGTALWGFIEAHAYTLRRRSILVSTNGTYGAPQTEAGITPATMSGMTTARTGATTTNQSLRILHLSDIHMVKRQHRKADWIRSLAATEPDLIVLTGDLLADTAALPELLRALEPFANTPGAFVFGSNDYYSPHFKNPLSYLLQQWTGQKGTDKYRDRQRDLPWREMTTAFEQRGWFNLNNTRAHVPIGSWDVSLVGVDDPHIGLDRFPQPAVSSKDNPPLQPVHIGLTHAPYQRILNRMEEDSCALVFSGHTHGGQVCLPGYGTIVTNCDIDRELAYGLFRWPPTKVSSHKNLRRNNHVVKGDGAVAYRDTGSAEFHPMWVNVTTGLGTSPYSPVRVACRPEAVQIDLIAL